MRNNKNTSGYSYKKAKRNIRDKIIISVLMLAIILTIVVLAKAIIFFNAEDTHPQSDSLNSGEHQFQINHTTGSASPPLTSAANESPVPAIDRLAEYAASNSISVDQYPLNLITLLTKNPETEEFVLGYPLNKNNRFTGSLTELSNCTSVPLIMQWDTRWGYTPYGDDVMGLTGCGPTTLSMVAIYLLKDTSLTPPYIAAFSTDNGYCVPGSGTAWSLMTEGARRLGLKSEELPLDKNRIVAALDAGKPVICIMGPGYFTDNGHFIVITDYVDGKFKVNDCNSHANTEKLWDYDDIKGQIKNLWAFSV